MIQRNLFNLAEYFVERHVNEGRGDRTAVRVGDVSKSYEEVLSDVNRAAAGLAHLGVGHGDRVMLVLPDGVEFVAAFFGAMRIGAVSVPCNTLLRDLDYANLIKQAQPKVIIADSRIAAVFDQELPSGTRVVVTVQSRVPHISWHQWLSGQDAVCKQITTVREDVAFWLWTSGTTGAPKAVVHRHADWLHCCECYGKGVLDICEEDITLSSSKLFHAYGLGNSLMFPFYVGASSVLIADKLHASALLRQLRTVFPTILFSTPSVFAAILLDTDCGATLGLNSIRIAVSAAEPLPADIFISWRDRFGLEILDGIGSSEALHIYISSYPATAKPGSTGKLVHGYEARITDAKREDTRTGEIGDLWIKGESLATYYWDQPELTAKRMNDGWFLTGDKFRVDAEGYFWYAGRSDDMFRVSGEWVSPFEIESILLAHPAVMEVAVVPFANEHGLLQVKACVVLKPGWSPEQSLVISLQKWVRSRLSGYKYPRTVEFRDELPKTANGKLQRFRL